MRSAGKCFFSAVLMALASGQSPEDIGGMSTPPSGCQLCSSFGDCSHAFRDGPGQYCGVWMDRSSHELPCCCPLNTVCNVSPADYVCTCAYVGAMPPYHSERDLMNKVLLLWWILGIVLAVAACGACVYFLVRKLMNQSDESLLYTSPEMIAPLISPTREALYGSRGQTSAVTVASGLEDVRGGDGKVQGVDATHPPPSDDLDVGGDGYDGGLEVVGEVEEGRNDEKEEEVALLTVSAQV